MFEMLAHFPQLFPELGKSSALIKPASRAGTRVGFREIRGLEIKFWEH
jgi:hypothetical protein